MKVSKAVSVVVFVAALLLVTMATAGGAIEPRGGVITSPFVVTGPGYGGGPNVRTFSPTNTSGDWSSNFMAYGPGFTGGVRVAAGDVDNDGHSDVITGAGPGGAPHVMAYSNDGSSVLQSFLAYGSFTGGVFVASGDVNGDGTDDIVTGPGAGGGPHVKVFDGTNPSNVLHSFYAYAPWFSGGVTVAAGDVNADGKADIITGAGPGGGPHVIVFDGANPANVLLSFFAYGSFTGGVFVAAGDMNGDGKDDIVTGAGPGGGPHVKAFRGTDGVLLHSFFAYANGFTGGVRVASGDKNDDGWDEIVTGAGPGGGPHVRVLEMTGGSITTVGSFFAYPSTFGGGVYVGFGDEQPEI